MRSILQSCQLPFLMDLTEHNIRRVVCQVQEKCGTVHGAILLKVLGEESTCLQVHTHSTEDNREVVIVLVVHTLVRLLYETSLSTNLCGDFIVRQTGCGKNGNLLTTGD